ncbi:HalOD1 output domain-containing protein [Haloterrigena salinisoli]|uniref:HalOD1 output domain-containing protein n=1 Tax=Haloterrigena salinisoli TaxID=3132747 RepID=UPI0030D5800B
MSNSFIGSTDNGFDGDISIAVVTAIASERGVEPTELPPLYESLDPDALDALFAPTRTGGPRRGRLEFTYAGHEVVVECGSDLEISVDGTSTTAEPVSAGRSERFAESRTDA